MKGLSLSFCVKDIAKGNVDYDDVEYISASTKCKNLGEYQKVLAQYKEYYWEGSLDAVGIALKLWDEGKIRQPRLTCGEANDISNGVWVN